MRSHSFTIFQKNRFLIDMRFQRSSRKSVALLQIESSLLIEFIIYYLLEGLKSLLRSFIISEESPLNR